MKEWIKIGLVLLSGIVAGAGAVFAIGELKGEYKARLNCLEEIQKVKDENADIKLNYLVLLAGHNNQD